MSWNKTVLALALGATLMACTTEDSGRDAAGSKPTGDAADAAPVPAPSVPVGAVDGFALQATTTGDVASDATQGDDINAADDEAAELAADAAEIAAEQARDAAAGGKP